MPPACHAGTQAAYMSASPAIPTMIATADALVAPAP